MTTMTTNSEPTDAETEAAAWAGINDGRKARGLPPLPDPFFTGDDPKEPKTLNDYIIGVGENLPNHSESIRGRGKYIRQMRAELPTFRDRQTAYRFCAYVLLMADMLPDEEGQEGITFPEVLSAIQNV